MKQVRRGAEVDRETPGNKNSKDHEHDQGIKGEEQVVQVRESASAAH